MMRLPCSTLATLLILVTLLPGRASAQPTPTPPPVTGVGATPIAAYQGRLVWSRPAPGGGYQLVQRIGSEAVQVLPIAGRSVPFDVDLGPTSAGTIYAVYSRCTTEPAWNGQQMPEYRTGKDCNIYRYDFTAQTETRYSAVNAGNGSQFWPTYWKGKVGFVRSYSGSSSKQYIYAKTIVSGKPSQQQALGPVPSSGSYEAGQLELYGSRLGFAWQYTQGTGSPTFQVRVDTVGTSQGTVIDSVSGGGLSELEAGWPSFESGNVYWVRACVGDPGGCQSKVSLRRSNYVPPLKVYAAPSPPYVQSIERDRSITWTETDINSIFACQTDPTSVPSCMIQPLQPDYTAASP